MEWIRAIICGVIGGIGGAVIGNLIASWVNRR